MPDSKIYTYSRASIVAQSLTINGKFARHFSSSRISVDKRFLFMSAISPLFSPCNLVAFYSILMHDSRGGVPRKITTSNAYVQKIKQKIKVKILFPTLIMGLILLVVMLRCPLLPDYTLS